MAWKEFQPQTPNFHEHFLTNKNESDCFDKLKNKQGPLWLIEISEFRIGYLCNHVVISSQTNKVLMT